MSVSIEALVKLIQTHEVAVTDTLPKAIAQTLDGLGKLYIEIAAMSLILKEAGILNDRMLLEALKRVTDALSTEKGQAQILKHAQEQAAAYEKDQQNNSNTPPPGGG